MDKPDSVHVQALTFDEKAEVLAVEVDPDAGLSEQERQKKVWNSAPMSIILACG